MYKHSESIKIIFLIGLLVFLSGCTGSAYHYYSGNHLPKAELAIIKPWFSEEYKVELDVFPAFIDGKGTEIYRRIALPSHYVLPGEHKINISLTTNQFRINDPKVMILHAKANHTYLTKASVTKLSQSNGEIKVKTNFWIEDEKTKEVVSGSRLTK